MLQTGVSTKISHPHWVFQEMHQWDLLIPTSPHTSADSVIGHAVDD